MCVTIGLSFARSSSFVENCKDCQINLFFDRGGTHCPLNMYKSQNQKVLSTFSHPESARVNSFGPFYRPKWQISRPLNIATGQEMVRAKKIVQGQGIVREFQFFSEGILKSSNGVREKRNVKSAYFYFSLFPLLLLFSTVWFFCTFNGHESCCIGRILFMREFEW